MIKNIEKNYNRFLKEDFSLKRIYIGNNEWPGDFEGRILLALVCHYNISKQINPNLPLMVEKYDDIKNEQGYLGKIIDENSIDEQQLSGHNWLLRGFIEHYIAFHDEKSLYISKDIVNNLFLKASNGYDHYPIKRNNKLIGKVDGNISTHQNGWSLSTDIGCAFMPMDGLSEYYALTKDEKVRDMYDKIRKIFVSLDFIKLRVQTHATLSATRSLISMYKSTNDESYLKDAIKIFNLYLEKGMTLTYENFNWFGRFDTWTEPCAVVDSFIISIELYKTLNDDKYRVLARRIWFNGLQFEQRKNGGAGPNTCVTVNNPVLSISMYEASFCCSMRYAEGLLYYKNNEDLFHYDENSNITIDEFGRKFRDDKLIVLYNGKEVPIFSMNEIEDENTKVEIIY